MQDKMKFQSFLLQKNHIKAMVKAMKEVGLTLDIDWAYGTVVAKWGEIEVFRAIEKGRNQPWIVRHVVDLFS